MEDKNQTTGNAEDRRQYLGFIQSIISRMAQNSASLKQWLAPILAIVFGFAADRKNGYALLAGICVTIAFWLLDAQYLRLERGYRHLFRKAVAGDTETYDLNPRLGDGGPRDYLKALFSWSTAGYYLTLTAMGTALFAITA